MINQSLEQMFEENLRSWKMHIRANSYSSITSDSIDCPAYINIVAMGKEVLPLVGKELSEEVTFGEEAKDKLNEINKKIFGRVDPNWEKETYFLLEKDSEYLAWKEKYQKLQENPYFLLTSLVSKIVGEEFQIPKLIRGKVDKIAIYTLGWLNGYLSK